MPHAVATGDLHCVMQGRNHTAKVGGDCLMCSLHPACVRSADPTVISVGKYLNTI